ncbi:MAG: type I secretion system permease/ATPase [Pseudomonadota bacterium]
MKLVAVPNAVETSAAESQPVAPDAVQRCVAHAALLQGRPISQALFEEALRPDEDDGGLRAAIRAAHAGGFETGFGPMSLGEFDAASLPAVVLTDEGALVLEARTPKGWSVFDPRLDGSAATEISTEALKSVYSGHALILRPRAQETSHTPQSGHWFRSALAQNRWTYGQVALAAAVSNLLGLTTSIFIMVVYDRVLPNQALESLVALTIGVGVALTFDFLIRSLRAGFIDRAGQKADLSMGRAIFDQVMSLRMNARSGSTGSMAASLREFETIRDFFTSASLVALVDLPFVALFVFVIYAIGGPVAVVPMLAVPAVLLVTLATQPFLRRLAEQSFEDGQSKHAVLYEALSGLETIKATRAETHMKTRWERAVAAHATHSVRSRAISQFALNATSLVQQTAQVAVVVYGVVLITQGSLSMGALIASVILTGRALGPLGQIAQTLTRITHTRTAYRAIDRLMQAETERPAGRRYLARDNIRGDVSFHGVRFSYPNAQGESLSGVDLDIGAGEKVAILGPIGSGKSTLARLVLGLYQPDAGSVRLDGTDLRQIDPGDLRRNIGAVLQDSWLVSGTLRDNIAIGMPRATDAEVLAAAKLAGVDDFAAKMPAGYDFEIGERGEGLSGGQRQAISLARGLMGRPAVLVMDEPTSAMDMMTEKKVIERLGADLQDQTLIVITHRPSLLELVDRVIVIQDGKITADGPKDTIVSPAQKAAF